MEVIVLAHTRGIKMNYAYRNTHLLCLREIFIIHRSKYTGYQPPKPGHRHITHIKIIYELLRNILLCNVILTAIIIIRTNNAIRKLLM
jgi:hypothetical protein